LLRSLKRRRDTPPSLLGDIGKTIAFYYLRRRGFLWVLGYVRDRSGSSWLLPIYGAERSIVENHGKLLTEAQRTYLDKQYDAPRGQGYLWDFIGIPFDPGGERPPCLIDVKTRRKSTSKIHVKRRDFSYEKSLGFRVLLAIVTLHRSWRYDVEIREL
jgi:hypothetical protein